MGDELDMFRVAPEGRTGSVGEAQQSSFPVNSQSALCRRVLGAVATLDQRCWRGEPALNPRTSLLFPGLLQWSEASGRRGDGREEEKRGEDQGTLGVGFDAGRGQNCSGPGGRHVAHTGEAWPSGQGCRGGQRGVFWALWAVMVSFPLTDRLRSPQKRSGCGGWLTPKQQEGEWQQGPGTQLNQKLRDQKLKYQLQGTGGKGPG